MLPPPPALPLWTADAYPARSQGMPGRGVFHRRRRSRAPPILPTTASRGVSARIWVRRNDMAPPRTIGVRLAAVLGCVCFALLSACTAAGSSSTAAIVPASPPASPDKTHTPSHQNVTSDAPLVVIFMENHEQGDVAGSSSAPYQNELARRGRIYTNYFAITHPSLPNYLAFASGSTHGKTNDDIMAGEIDGPSLWTQLTAAGIKWAVYEESMPSPCFTEYSSGSS